MAAVCALGSWNRNDPLAGDFEPISDELQFLLGVIGFQSLAQRSAPNTTAAQLQQVECRRCHLEAGKTKERRVRGRGRDTVKRHFIGGDAPVDFLSCLVRRDLHQAAVEPGMMPDGVALGRAASVVPNADPCARNQTPARLDRSAPPSSSSARFAPNKRSISFWTQKKWQVAGFLIGRKARIRFGNFVCLTFQARPSHRLAIVRAAENHFRAVNDNHDIANRRIPITPDLDFRRSVFAGHRNIFFCPEKGLYFTARKPTGWG